MTNSAVPHAAIVTTVSQIAFDQAVDSLRAGGKVIAVGLPKGKMGLSIVKTMFDGIQVAGSLVGTRQDLKEASNFGNQTDRVRMQIRRS